MSTQPERRLKIARIKALPKALAAAVKGLDSEQLLTPYRDGGWTVAQVVHHLADSHATAYIRMKLIATEEGPPLKPYDQDKWADLPDGKSAAIASSLSLLKGLHRRWADWLKKVPRKEWARTGVHPDHGLVSLDSMLELYANHGEKHLRQIVDLRERRGW
jgi:DinB superfamily